MIRQEVKVGQKFQIGNVNNKIRVLTVTSVSTLGAVFSVTPGTWESNNTEMYADYRNTCFWNGLKPYKEKVIHKRDVVFWKFNPGNMMGRDSEPVHSYLYNHGQVLDNHVTELSRTTVEYTEEK